MLKTLRVTNFALIEDVKLEFDKGFTVITGETGAGKSILIDAISYVLGTKFNKEFIRYGEEVTRVKATFDTPETLRKSISTKTIEIERENHINGKSITKLNGEQVTVSQIKDISKHLLDIHGQHNNQNLLDPLLHIQYLDLFSQIDEQDFYIEYRKGYERLKALESKLHSLTRGNERDRLIDFLKYQIEEIKKANLSIEEEAELLEKSNVLTHSQKIGEALNTASLIMNSDENNVQSMLTQTIKQLNSIVNVMPKVENIVNQIEEAYYTLQENARDIDNLREGVYFDQGELDEVNSRLFTYNTLKKKYNLDIVGILDFLKEKEEELYELENRESLIVKVKSQIVEEKGRLFSLGKEIHDFRVKSSKKLAEGINRELKEVGLSKADFMPEVIGNDSLLEKGTDTVLFMISTNTGEPRKSLERIVSGGELSRIMLAMKSVFIDKDNIPTVIFDEIDTGISGKIAEAVGLKMYRISMHTQVLCVTHLPQIASYSDNHLTAKKEEHNKRTFSKVVKATDEEKSLEIAKMLSGEEVTEKTIENAKEIIKNIDIKKKELHKKS